MWQLRDNRDVDLGTAVTKLGGDRRLGRRQRASTDECTLGFPAASDGYGTHTRRFPRRLGGIDDDARCARCRCDDQHERAAEDEIGDEH